MIIFSLVTISDGNEFAWLGKDEERVSNRIRR